MNISINGGNTPCIQLAGPLNLDKRTKKAETVMGTQLLLSDKEFDTLAMLAAQEGKAMTFNSICESIWNAGNDPAQRSAARASLSRLVKQVGEAGLGFMWIEQGLEDTYAFRSHWAHNWHENTAPAERANQSKSQSEATQTNPMSKPVRKHPRTSAIATAACAAVVLGMAALMQFLPTDGDKVIIEDAGVPMASFPQEFVSSEQSEISYPAIGDIYIKAGDTQLDVELANPPHNDCTLVFEIVLENEDSDLSAASGNSEAPDAQPGRPDADPAVSTGTSYYISGNIAPGETTGAIVAAYPLRPGEYAASLIIRAYSPNGFLPTEEISSAFYIYVRQE
ncbi:MAG: hypothetical protein FWG48_05200 [Oscillospiraceae bacterium]|nr:hypothetical protein [Oscillospiraceae bacterium]